jgi:cytoskeleton protein RodZ
MLKAAREASGLHIAALAVSMKVPVKKLEALESDRLDLLLDSVFARALASSVCRTLKIDPRPILNALPQSAVPRLDTEVRAINAPFRVPGESNAVTVPAFLTHPAALTVLALLVGVLVVALWPESRATGEKSAFPANPATPSSEPVTKSPEGQPLFPPNSDPPQGVVQGAATAASVPGAGAPAPLQVLTQAPAPVPAIAVAATVAPVAVSSAATVMPAPPVPTTPKSASVSTSAGSGVAPAADLPSVSFKVKGTSWVEVTDGKGVLQLRKTLLSGESATASGVPPLIVVVGRVDATVVEVRGKPYPLEAIAKENVARFEVK